MAEIKPHSTEDHQQDPDLPSRGSPSSEKMMVVMSGDQKPRGESRRNENTSSLSEVEARKARMRIRAEEEQKAKREEAADRLSRSARSSGSSGARRKVSTDRLSKSARSSGKGEAMAELRSLADCCDSNKVNIIAVGGVPMLILGLNWGWHGGVGFSRREDSGRPAGRRAFDNPQIIRGSTPPIPTPV